MVGILALLVNGIKTTLMTNNYYGIRYKVLYGKRSVTVRKVSSVITESLLLHPAAAFDSFEGSVRDRLLCSFRLSLGYKPYTP